MSIKTLAFFDLETTGLPEYDGFSTKIIELSIIACSTEHIENLKKITDIPRVLHKLTICLNPMKRIEKIPEKISGLDNYQLENENKFTTKTADLILSFFEHLQSPICLIAHNGNKLDFPLFKKHFEKVDKEFPESILYIDSLDAFREIDELIHFEQLETNEQRETNIINKSTDNEGNLSSSPDDIFKIDDIDYQKLNETTPSRRTESINIRKSKNTPQSKTPASSAENSPIAAKRSLNPKARMELFPDKFKKGRYTLTSIYERKFNEKPTNSHYAEADVIALLKCVVAERQRFLQFVENKSRPFSEIKSIGYRL